MASLIPDLFATGYWACIGEYTDDVCHEIMPRRYVPVSNWETPPQYNWNVVDLPGWPRSTTHSLVVGAALKPAGPVIFWSEVYYTPLNSGDTITINLSPLYRPLYNDSLLSLL